MARTSVTSPAESLAGMARTGSPREPMREINARADNVSGKPVGGTAVKRKGNQAGDPTAPGTAKARSQKMAETSGAQHGITARVTCPVSPEAGKTTANGRLMPSVIHRQKPNFSGGVADSVGR